MAWITVDDRHDPRVSPYREIAHRIAVEHGDSFIAEGRWMVERLLASPYRVRSMIVAENRVDEWRGRVPESVPVFVMRVADIKELLGFNFHRGVLACGERARVTRFELPATDSASHSLVVACPRVVNPENLGSIIRSATAFGADAVFCGQVGADPFSRRVIRVSAGNVFRIPVIQPDDLEGELQRLRQDAGYRWLATAVGDESTVTPLAACVRPSRSVLLLGAEDFGLESSWIEQADERLSIPMSPGTDSLNVAITAAVVLYALTQGNVAARRDPEPGTC